jgi:hypothetical protein
MLSLCSDFMTMALRRIFLIVLGLAMCSKSRHKLMTFRCTLARDGHCSLLEVLASRRYCRWRAGDPIYVCGPHSLMDQVRKREV